MKIAGVQIDVQLARPAENLRRMREFLAETSAAGGAADRLSRAAL